MKTSSVLYKKNLRSCSEINRLDSRQVLVVYDRKLMTYPFFRTWLKKFPNAYPVTAGEKLKTISQYEKLCRFGGRNLNSVDRKAFVVVAIGGGSIGDFAGFFASTFKRGLKLWHLPTTWLAAIDSAHGGKTALNVDELKNQVGSFYFAEKVFVIEEFFKGLPGRYFSEGLAEVIKIGMVSPKPFLVEKKYFEQPLKHFPTALIKKSIRAKWNIVKKDPYENKGVRFILNFGHTFGHAIEIQESISHGKAVANGLEMAIELSHYFGHLSQDRYLFLTKYYSSYFAGQRLWGKRKFNSLFMQRHLLKDKKASTNQRIQFVFLNSWGKPVVKKVPVAELVEAALAVAGEFN